MTGKIDKPRALRLLANGHSKADVARVFHVSRAAVTQALRPVAAVETVAAATRAVVRPIAPPPPTPTVVSGNPRNPSDAEIPKPRPEDHEYDVQGWESKYLAWARARGTLARAAAYAGIRPRVAEARMAEDADFAQAVAEAQAEHADSLEEELLGNPRPVGHIVRLKGERPTKFIERQAVVNLNLDASTRPPADPDKLLRDMLGSMTPATVAVIEQLRNKQGGPGLALTTAPDVESPA